MGKERRSPLKASPSGSRLAALHRNQIARVRCWHGRCADAGTPLIQRDMETMKQTERRDDPNIKSKWTRGSGLRKLTACTLIMAVPILAWGAVPDAQDYTEAAWSPYLAGGLIGVLIWFTMLWSGKPVGASSAYATTAGMLGAAVAPDYTKRLPYFREKPPGIGWEFVFIAATIVGAFLAAWQGGELTQRWLPPFWEARFGEGTLLLRGVVALVGGCLMAFGARMAGGCTSGHGISGTLQLNVASWISLICFFFGGSLTANLMFRL